MAAKKDDKKKPEEEAGRPPISKLTLILLVLVALNLGATGFVAYMSLNPVTPPAVKAEGGEGKEGEVALMGPVTDLDTFIVNLNEPGSARYLRTRLQVEVSDQAALERLEASKPVVRSALLGYLSSLSVDDTLGAESKVRITDELIAKLDKLMGEDVVKNLFFTEFVVQ